MRHSNVIRLDIKSFGLSAERTKLRSCLDPANLEPSRRELAIENLLCRGYTQENIAAIFGRSVKTISVQAASLYRKRGVHSQVGLLLAYLERQGIFVFGEESDSCGATEYLPLEAAQ